MEKVIEAAQKAQLHDFVMSLPNVSTCKALTAQCSLQQELLQNHLKSLHSCTFYVLLQL